MPDDVKITFGIIVLNGEPFTRYIIRSLYRYAHEIIVVEGACRGARAIAANDGHSTDGTYEVLKALKEHEDHENKVIIVSAYDEGYHDGFWPEKGDMSSAYAKRATGNYLWQVDSDEFYRAEDIEKISHILSKGIDAATFPMLSFWGGINYTTNGFYLIRDKGREFHRLFAWAPSYKYISHRPPTVVDEHGVDLRNKRWLTCKETEKLGVFLYHYSLLFPSQVSSKVSYYATPDNEKAKQGGGYNPAITTWKRTVFAKIQRPYRIHNVFAHVSWLERYHGKHPEQVVSMMNDIDIGTVTVVLRNNDDVETLLSNSAYVISTKILSFVAHILSFQIVYNSIKHIAQALESIKYYTRRLFYG